MGACTSDDSVAPQQFTDMDARTDDASGAKTEIGGQLTPLMNPITYHNLTDTTVALQTKSQREATKTQQGLPPESQATIFKLGKPIAMVLNSAGVCLMESMGGEQLGHASFGAIRTWLQIEEYITLDVKIPTKEKHVDIPRDRPFQHVYLRFKCTSVQEAEGMKSGLTNYAHQVMRWKLPVELEVNGILGDVPDFAKKHKKHKKKNKTEESEKTQKEQDAATEAERREERRERKQKLEQEKNPRPGKQTRLHSPSSASSGSESEISSSSSESTSDSDDDY